MHIQDCSSAISLQGNTPRQHFAWLWPRASKCISSSLRFASMYWDNVRVLVSCMQSINKTDYDLCGNGFFWVYFCDYNAFLHLLRLLRLLLLLLQQRVLIINTKCNGTAHNIHDNIILKHKWLICSTSGYNYFFNFRTPIFQGSEYIKGNFKPGWLTSSLNY